MEPNDFVKRLKEYPLASHKAWEAKDVSGVLKMDWNESDLHLPVSIRNAVIDSIQNGQTHWYPSVANPVLLARIAEYVGVPETQVQYFAGEDAALDYTVRTFISPGDEVGLIAPTYDNFRVFVESVGAVPVFMYGEDLFSPDVEAIKRAITPTMKMVYLVNPNNPTGTLYSQEHISELLRSFPGVLFIVDEAYTEFAGTSVVSLVDQYVNLVVGRSFSKAFGLASFRLGYLVSQTKNIGNINKIRNGKSVSAVAQTAAITALGDTGYVSTYVKEVTQARAFMCKELEALGFAPKETPANFILVEVPDTTSFCSALQSKDVFVRNLNHLVGMEGYVRITVGSIATTQKFLSILRELIEHGAITLKKD